MTPTWGDLFERAAAYDVSEDDVRRALAGRRDDASDAGDGSGGGSDAGTRDEKRENGPGADGDG